MEVPRRATLLLSAVLLVALLPTAGPSPARAEPPIASGTVFDPATGVPRGQWESFFDANERGGFLLWWDSFANQARIAFPCAVASDGQVVLEFILYQFGSPQPDGENAGGGPRRPAARDAGYQLPTPLLNSLGGWSPLISGRLVLDPQRTRAGYFFGKQLWTHQWTDESQWTPLSPDGNVSPSAWIDEGFTQISSPLLWPPNTTVETLPAEGFPFNVNNPPFDPFARLTPGTRPCALDPLPRPVPQGGAAGVTGLVRSAVTGQGLAGATVSGGGQVTTTGADGAFTLTGLPSGLVPVTTSLDGYIPDSVDVTLAPDRVTNQVFALSPSLQSGQQLRVVLTWGESPQDLDAHLWIPAGSGGTTEVFYANPGALSGPPFAALDVDDRNGRGPETVTIGQLATGRCVYAVHNYSGETPIPSSGARVQVIQGSSVVQTFTPPAGSGAWWHVFGFDCATGNLSQINILSDSPPSATPGAPATTATSTTGGGGVEGLVRNASNGQPVANATVSAGGRTATTDSAGRYQITGLEPGPASVSVSASGFITDTANVNIPTSGSATQTFALSQALAEGQLRIILTWGSAPLDLDAYLFVPSEVGFTQVYYGDAGSTTTMPFAALDVDDRNGLGPETITITRLSPGTFTYSVNNYSGEASLSSSGARVQVIQGSSVVQSFMVPTGNGLWWNVFTIDGSTGSLTPLNRLSDRGR